MVVDGQRSVFAFIAWSTRDPPTMRGLRAEREQRAADNGLETTVLYPSRCMNLLGGEGCTAEGWLDGGRVERGISLDYRVAHGWLPSMRSGKLWVGESGRNLFIAFFDSVI